eukprot:scaffold29524_cov34-Tisochrysis_lutea.AAC.1
MEAPTPRRQLSGRMKDYLYPVESPAQSQELAQVSVLQCETTEGLAEIRGRLRKMDHSPRFLSSIFEQRDKQLYPRDLLAAYVPSKRSKGSMRPVGIIRRSLKFEKKHNCTSLYIDFVWVFPECRGQQLGRMLLHAGLVFGKPKDVRLVVAGSVENLVAIRLYESIGFNWTDATCSEMLLTAEQAQTCVDAYAPPTYRVSHKSSSASSAASDAMTDRIESENIASLANDVGNLQVETDTIDAGSANAGAVMVSQSSSR